MIISLTSTVDETVVAGIMGAGTANVECASSLSGSLRQHPPLDAEVVVDTALSEHVASATIGDGLASVEMDASATATLWQHPSLSANVAIGTDFDGQVSASQQVGGGAAIEIGATGTLAIGNGLFSGGITYMHIQGKLLTAVGRSGMVEGHAGIRISSELREQLTLGSGGSALIDVAATGEGRTGRHLGLAGEVAFSLYGRGDLNTWHGVYAGGEAGVEIICVSEVAGRPDIPGTYWPCHPDWRMSVPAAPWQFDIPKEQQRGRL